MSNNKRRKFVAAAIIAVLMAIVLFFFLHRTRNHPPQITMAAAVPDTVLTAGRAQMVVQAMDPDGDNIAFFYQVQQGAFTQENGQTWWTAPQVKESSNVEITVTAKDPHGAKDVKTVNVMVVPVGWHGLLGSTVVDTVIDLTEENEVKLNFGDMKLPGKSIRYTYSATGGTFDTLPNGEVVWRAPQVDHDTTFVITQTAINEKGERIVKSTVVSVKAHPAAKSAAPAKAREKGIVRKDTSLTSGETVSLSKQKPFLEGKDVKYSYAATGGVFDTLPSGEIVWRAPDVNKPTAFTITIEAVNEKGEKVTETITVMVYPKKATAESLAVAARGKTTAATAIPESGKALPETTKALPAAAGPPVLIYGTIENTQNKPLVGVTVSCNDTSVEADQLGNYHFNTVWRGKSLLVNFRKEAYEAVVKEVAFTTEKEVLVNVVMRMEGSGRPAGVVARAVPDSVIVSWEGADNRQLLGYNVYRSTDEYSGFERLNKKPMAVRKYIDTDVKDSVQYYYKVAAVNLDELESELSDAASVVVPIKLFAVKGEYPSPFANPTGIVYDGHDIWTCDNLRGEIYRHDWEMRVAQTYKSPGESPTGLAWDGAHLWSCDFQARMIYEHDKDLKVIKKFRGPGYNLTDMTWDGENLWVVNSDGEIYCVDTNGKRVARYKSPYSLATGIAWDGAYLWVSSIHSKKIYRLTKDMNIDDTYESPYLLSDGFAFDGKYFWACGKVTEKIYKFSWR